MPGVKESPVMSVESVSEKLNNLIQSLEMLASVVGANVVKLTYSPDVFTAFACFMLCVHHISHVHCFFFYYYKDNIMMAFRSLCTLGFGTQGIVKLASALKYKKTFRSIFTFIRYIYSSNEKGSMERLKLLESSIETCLFYGTIVKRVVLTSLAAIFVYPIGYYYYFNQREYFYASIIPKTNPDTIFGYILNLGSQLASICIGSFGTLASDLSLAFICIKVRLLSKLLKISFDETEKLLHSNEGKNITIVETKLRNCVKMHQDITSLVELINKCYAAPIFVQIAFSVIPIALLILNIFFTNWISGYGLLGYYFMQFLIYCLIGTLVEITNDEITDIIYDFKWYLFPVPCQKLILLMLLRSQNAKNLMIINIVPLNVQTGTAVMKTIYSYLMLLINFLE